MFIRNLCFVLELIRGWGNELGFKDIKIGDDVECFRFFRNKNFVYVDFGIIFDDMFEDFWRFLKVVLSRFKCYLECGVDYEYELIEIICL